MSDDLLQRAEAYRNDPYGLASSRLIGELAARVRDLEDWRAGVNRMARPGDVANLVLERDALRALLEKLRHRAHLDDRLWQWKDVIDAALKEKS